MFHFLNSFDLDLKPYAIYFVVVLLVRLYWSIIYINNKIKIERFSLYYMRPDIEHERKINMKLSIKQHWMV